jgi:hypothetical protein
LFFRFATRAVSIWPVLALTAMLTISVMIVSPKKPFWNDEFFSWYFLTADFPTMLRAFHDALNNTPFLYFGLGWLWTQAFGGSELSLRLFSSLGISLAGTVMWLLLRRCYGFWPATLGVLGVFCTSELVMSQNAEARMYGLFLAVAAIAVMLCARLDRDARPGTRLLVANALAQTALVHVHLFGPFYSAALAAALVLSRATCGKIDLGSIAERMAQAWPVWLSFLLAWASFLLYVPAFQAQAEAGRPYSWMPMPSVADLAQLMTHGSQAFLRPELLLVALLLLHAGHVLLLGPRRSSPAPPNDRGLLIIAVALIAVPIGVWALSRMSRPIFYDRYLMPSLLGWTILAASATWRLLPGSTARLDPTRATLYGGAVAVLLAYPTFAALQVGPRYLPGSWDTMFGHADKPMVLYSGGGLLERLRYSPDSDPSRYFYVLDWDSVNRPESGRFGIQEYKHMQAWRRVFPERFQSHVLESEDFLAAHDSFIALVPDDYEATCRIDVKGLWRVENWGDGGLHCPQWVPRRLLSNPAYEVTKLGSQWGETWLLVERRDVGVPTPTRSGP